MTIKTGDAVKVNQDSDQYGRIAEYGRVQECFDNGEYLVLVGGQIRASIICQLKELTQGLSDSDLLTEYDKIRGLVSYYNAGFDYPDSANREVEDRHAAIEKMKEVRAEIESRKLTPHYGNYLVPSAFNPRP